MSRIGLGQYHNYFNSSVSYSNRLIKASWLKQYFVGIKYYLKEV